MAERQLSYDRCFVCGHGNPFGLHVDFYSEPDGVRAEFAGGPGHEGYPGCVHGGILFAILDETLSRCAYLAGQWVRTGRMEVRYRAEAPLGEPLHVRGRLVRWRGPLMEAEGEIRRADGRMVVEARGSFMRLAEHQVREMLARVGTND
ncbi:MAG: PaaI family thioesterase [Chloroflexi bacterium]|nr:PaaI family thioesterase [Chloroflexota bacterium]